MYTDTFLHREATKLLRETESAYKMAAVKEREGRMPSGTAEREAVAEGLLDAIALMERMGAQLDSVTKEVEKMRKEQRRANGEGDWL